MNDFQNDTDARLAQWLADDIQDAKRAPELAVWLTLGPLPISDLIAMRRELHGGGEVDDRAAYDYATASVMYDLGRVTGIAGPVEYRNGLLWLKDTHRAVVMAWWKDDLYRYTKTGPYAPGGAEG